MWSHMGHGGNSSTEQRIELMKRYVDEFGVESIQSLLADREFGGDDWFTYLVKNMIPFAIRLRKDMHIETEDGKHFHSFLHSFAKGVRDNGQAGYAAWPGHRKIYCGLEGKRSKTNWL